VLAVGDDKWVTNGPRFATKEEAEAYVLDLSLHYTMVRDTRAVEVDDPVNYTYHDHQLRAVEGITVRATRMLDHDENQLELPFGRVIGRRLAVRRDKRWSPGPSAAAYLEACGRGQTWSRTSTMVTSTMGRASRRKRDLILFFTCVCYSP
jgi:hypothetical protein